MAVEKVVSNILPATAEEVDLGVVLSNASGKSGATTIGEPGSMRRPPSLCDILRRYVDDPTAATFRVQADELVFLEHVPIVRE